MENKYKPIGVFDSGVGGISVLKEAVKQLPNEDFIYYGDSKNAPYGEKSVEEIKKLAFEVAEKLINRQVKAIVVACNTATSAAINDLRERYKNMPVIGIEPALKPAIKLKRDGKVIVMATPVTLKENKFMNLMKRYEDTAEMIPVPCAGLAEIIEHGYFDGPIVNNYIETKLAAYKNDKIAAIVLGCTHYPFIQEEISKVVNDSIPIIDGSEGTIKQLKRKLQSCNILNNKEEKGAIEIFNSLNNEMVELSYKLLSK
ncbi:MULTISPECIES: glutamate racemase [Clostridium]|uniref:glutamate racemase n=1 Tax=Clostridium TaxID=1485 RepID=UPI00069D6851|nr:MULTISPECIES: glutamate racemase [Clostridium]KOF56169.1 glutamate racemase [Clostridium sp. DMHC 10]MCD2348222.1 glutamate racemase [Clostridium guangxiense]